MLSIFEFIVLFAFGSIFGWIMEFFYRSIFEEKRIVNPGFLDGPYLPIYGFGTIFLYFISLIPTSIVSKAIMFLIMTTALELLVGLWFVNYYNIRLWDYSKRFMNYKGIICPLFSAYWLFLSLIFYFFIYPPLQSITLFFTTRLDTIFFVGLFAGVFFVDVNNSFAVANKIRAHIREFNIKKLAKFKVDYIKLKENLDKQLNQMKGANKLEIFFFSVTLNQKELFDQLNKFVHTRGGLFAENIKAKKKRITKAIKKAQNRK